MFFYEDKEYIPQNYEDEYLGLRDAAHGARAQPERRHGEGGGDGRLRPGRGPVDARSWASARTIKPYPGAGARLLRGHAARDGDRLQRARQRRPQGRAGHACSSVADDKGAVARAAPAAAARARGARGVRLPRDEHDAQRAQRRHRRRRAAPWASRPTPRARPAPPTTCATPGSPASRPTCCASSGWASTTTRPSNLSGARAALPIWVDFMKAALGGPARHAFPPPPEDIVFVDIDQRHGPAARARAARGRVRRRSSPAPSPASPAAPTSLSGRPP